MDDLYLKEVELSDIEILKEYNNSCYEFNEKGWLNEDRFRDLLIEWANNKNDNSKVHFYPFWLMNKNISVGVVILKSNIEVNEMWKKFGGHISYVIGPKYRKKGYGRYSLHLALEKCKELGINKTLVTCLDTNVGSRKIIESNYGKLEEICIDNLSPSFEGKLMRRYFIDVDESLKLYNENLNKTEDNNSEFSRIR